MIFLNMPICTLPDIETGEGDTSLKVHARNQHSTYERILLITFIKIRAHTILLAPYSAQEAEFTFQNRRM